MPRLSLTPDEEAHLRPMLDAYRANKREVSAFNAGLEAAANLIASTIIADFPTPGDAVTFLCGEIHNLKKEL